MAMFRFLATFVNTIRIYFFNNPILVSTGYRISCWDTPNISRNSESPLTMTSKSSMLVAIVVDALKCAISIDIRREDRPRPVKSRRYRDRDLTSAKDGRLLVGRQLIKAPYVKLYSILKTSSTSADSEQIQDSEVSIIPTSCPVIDIYHRHPNCSMLNNAPFR